MKAFIKKVIKKCITTPSWELYQQWKNREEQVIDKVSLGKHVVLYPPYACYDVSVSDYTYIAPGSKISQTSIGKFCSIGPNFLCGWGIHPINGISTSPMFYSPNKQNGLSLSEESKVKERKSISIGNDVFIGANVTILDGVNIGHGAVIGAGAVVSKDIPPYAIAVGCPIQIVRYRFDKETIEKFLEIKWWDYTEDQLKSVERNFFDIDSFIEKAQQNKL